MNPLNSVKFLVNIDSITNRPEVGFEPEADDGDVLQEENFKDFEFVSACPFVIFVSRRLSGPYPIFSPFKGKRILKSEPQGDGTYKLSQVDSKVDVPAGKFGYYTFCYLVILFTDLKDYPVLVSKDPKIIIGKQSLGGSSDGPDLGPEAITAEQTMKELFPDLPAE